jgi:protein TonB
MVGQFKRPRQRDADRANRDCISTLIDYHRITSRQKSSMIMRDRLSLHVRHGLRRSRHFALRAARCLKAHVDISRGILLFMACAVAGCTITPPQRPLIVTPSAAINSATLDQYRSAVAKRILERSPSYVLRGTPQAMLRSLVVVSFTVDRTGQLVQSAVYRTNGDDEAESTALATLRRAAPLPQPPAKLLNGRGQVELFEDWLFNDDGKFQLRTFASPQAQTID